MKLVTGAGQSSEPHAFEAMVDFEMCKTHLDTLALVTRLEELVPINRRAKSRGSSWMSRGICRAGVLGQHCVLSAQTSQSNFEAR